MRKLIETAALGLSLCLGAWSHVTYVHAQDPEEGAVDLNEAPRPAAKEPKRAEAKRAEAKRAEAARVEAARADSAWETPPGAKDNEDVRDSTPESAPESTVAVVEPGPGKLRVFLGARIGVGGGFLPKGEEYTWTARPTPGAQLGADYVVWKYFGIGLETRLAWAKQILAKHEYMLWDLVLKPRLLYRIKPQPVEIYLAVPGGLSFNKPGDQLVESGSGEFVREKGKLGATLGVMAGASYFFTDRWAINAELGWNWNFMRFGTYVTRVIAQGVPTMRVPTQARVRFGQAALAINALYAF